MHFLCNFPPKKTPNHILVFCLFLLAIDSFSEEDMRALQKWGTNIIRLGVMWPGVMPQKGFINETYLDLMERVVNKAAEFGIYSLVEVSQRLFLYCVGFVALPVLFVDHTSL